LAILFHLVPREVVGGILLCEDMAYARKPPMSS